MAWFAKGSGSVGGSNSKSSTNSSSTSTTDSNSTTRQGTTLGNETIQALLATLGTNLTNTLGDATFSRGAAIEDSAAAMQAAVQSAIQTGIGGVNSGQLGTGAYNSTTRGLLADNLSAEAAARGAAVTQQTIQDYAGIANMNQNTAIQALLSTLGIDQSSLSNTASTSTTKASSQSSSKSSSVNWNAATEGGWK